MYKITVRAWMTKKEENPLPMRTMVGIIERETTKAYYMKLHGKPEPSSKCLHCGRKITHPVSLAIGIGPICGGHYHINPYDTQEELEAHIEEIKSKLKSVTWEGWIPKSQITEMIEVEDEEEMVKQEQEQKFLVVFKYNGQIYRTITNNEKLTKIRENSEIIELEQIGG